MNSCVPPCSAVWPSVPKKPSRGDSEWQPTQLNVPSVTRPKKRSRPACCAGESVPSSARCGFGGGTIWSANVVNRRMSASAIGPPRPSRLSNATLNASNACSADSASPSDRFPPVRSPRQCIGPWRERPRSVCVVIGPFSGWNPCGSPEWMGFGFGATVASGLPRSHASPSWSPKTWQPAHAASPLLDVARASYSSGRPSRTLAGSGSCSRRCATSRRVATSITDTASSNRVST